MTLHGALLSGDPELVLPESNNFATFMRPPKPDCALLSNLALGFFIAFLAAIGAFISTLLFLIFLGFMNDLFSSSPDFHSLFLSIPTNDSVSASLYALTIQPHVAGTKGNMDTAAYVKQRFEEAGLSPFYADFDVLLSYPLHRAVTLTSPSSYTLKLKETSFNEDPYSSDTRVIDTFHAYSPSGNVEGRVVYSNYGRTEDFEELGRMGVNCTGAVVISRYGKIFRGDKSKNAWKAGAVASLVYSDPQEYAGGGGKPAYPYSAYLPPSGVQRGSIASFKGDALTPGWPSTPGSERLSPTDPTLLASLPPIPSIPISYEDALPILTQLKGQLAPKAWWGGLDVEYRVGPGPAEVKVELEMNNTIGPIRNVHAVIKGCVEPDRYILMGNHRDAWTFGAVDPNSGTAALIEVAKGFGSLLQSGWCPRRSIVLCNWDAEEYALIGSTEWVEANEDLLSSRAVAYLNVDVGVSGGGFFKGGACPQLDGVLRSVAGQVADPVDGQVSLYDKWRGRENVTEEGEVKAKVGRLGGAGTDYAGFLQHVGVPSFDMGFYSAEDGGNYPMYHSTYDNYHWMANFGDPGFHYHAAMGRMWGLLALTLADTPVLPFDFSAYARELKKRVEELSTKLKDRPVTTTPLTSPLNSFIAAAQTVKAQTENLSQKKGFSSGSEGEVRELNDRLMMTERAFISPEGLPGRPWFRHLVYAPSEDNGYGTAVFPGIVDAIARAEKGAENGWEAVQHEIFRVARAITKARNVLRGELS